MRISDWSSDVCSSDLLVAGSGREGLQIQVVEILYGDDRVERLGKSGRGERSRDGIDIGISGIDRGLIVAILLLEGDEFGGLEAIDLARGADRGGEQAREDRKSTRLNSSH